jgi:hypothetical protein
MFGYGGAISALKTYSVLSDLFGWITMNGFLSLMYLDSSQKLAIQILSFKVPKNIQGRSVLLQSPPAAPAPRVGNTVR